MSDITVIQTLDELRELYLDAIEYHVKFFSFPESQMWYLKQDSVNILNTWILTEGHPIGKGLQEGKLLFGARIEQITPSGGWQNYNTLKLWSVQSVIEKDFKIEYVPRWEEVAP